MDAKFGLKLKSSTVALFKLYVTKHFTYYQPHTDAPIYIKFQK